MARIRPAAIAGRFYDGEATALSASVAGHMQAASAPVTSAPATSTSATSTSENSSPVMSAPKAIIAPHAGHVYSGDCAAEAYARLLPDAGVIERIVLLGPCHRVAVRGLAMSSAAFWQTPLGPVEIDRAALDGLADLPQVSLNDEAHREEHSLEVHLPFLQHCFGTGFKLVPLAVGSASNEEVAAVLERLWGGPETRIVISTDLSHFLDYGTAQTLDGKTAAAIEKLDWQAIGQDQACGRIPMSGLLTIARRKGMAIERVGLVNSGDTAGSKDRVVGYGAWVLREGDVSANDQEPGEAAEGTSAPDPALVHGPLMLDLVGKTLRHAVDAKKPPNVNTHTFPEELKALRGTFVTLEVQGRLRGCIGTLEPHRPLIEDLIINAYKAGFQDPRFPALTAEEIDGLDWSISILTPKQEMTFADQDDLLAQLRPGIDGLIIQDGARRATFLPQVWDQIPQPDQFLGHLKKKAGLSPAHWSKDFKAWRYGVTKIA